MVFLVTPFNINIFMWFILKCWNIKVPSWLDILSIMDIKTELSLFSEIWHIHHHPFLSLPFFSSSAKAPAQLGWVGFIITAYKILTYLPPLTQLGKYLSLPFSQAQLKPQLNWAELTHLNWGLGAGWQAGKLRYFMGGCCQGNVSKFCKEW